MSADTQIRDTGGQTAEQPPRRADGDTWKLPAVCAFLIFWVVVCLASLGALVVAATEIQFWHAMTAVAGERVNDMAAKFNASQSDFVVKAVHKGSYA